MVVSLDHVAGEIDAEDDVMLSEDYGKVRAFHVVGTTDKVEEKREHMLEEYLVVVVIIIVDDDDDDDDLRYFRYQQFFYNQNCFCVSVPESRQKRAAFKIHELRCYHLQHHPAGGAGGGGPLGSFW